PLACRSPGAAGYSAAISLRRTHFHGIRTESLRHPALFHRLRAHADIGRVAMVRRAALPVVVQTVDWRQASRTRTVARWERDVERRTAFEQPVGVRLHRRTLRRERRVEVGALRRERGAEEPANR